MIYEVVNSIDGENPYTAIGIMLASERRDIVASLLRLLCGI